MLTFKFNIYIPCIIPYWIYAPISIYTVCEKVFASSSLFIFLPICHIWMIQIIKLIVILHKDNPSKCLALREKVNLVPLFSAATAIERLWYLAMSLSHRCGVSLALSSLQNCFRSATLEGFRVDSLTASQFGYNPDFGLSWGVQWWTCWCVWDHCPAAQPKCVWAWGHTLTAGHVLSSCFHQVLKPQTTTSTFDCWYDALLSNAVLVLCQM